MYKLWELLVAVQLYDHGCKPFSRFFIVTWASWITLS